MEISAKDGLAHDLKTPLTTIKGYASMLKDGVYGELDKQAQVALDKILTAADEMAEKIDNDLK